LFQSFIYPFGCFSVARFFYVFHRLFSFMCSIVRSSRDSGEALSYLWRVIRQEGDSAAIWLPGGV
jgi:hypothetical protein